MKGVEIDFVVTDSVAALELYEKIFEVERVEVTSFDRGQNEAVFNLYGVRFHMLDENPEFFLHAPTPDSPRTMWMNVMVEDIKDTWESAMAEGCTEVMPLTDMMDGAVTNAVFQDPFGYQWMLHQIHRMMSFEEREQMFEEQQKEEEQ